MTLIRRVNTSLPSLMESFLGRDFNEYVSSNVNHTLPAVNVLESKEDFRIEVAAPGLKKENFKLHINHNQLTISSEVESTKKTATEEPKVNGSADEKYTRREFSYQSFRRSFTLPQTVDTDKINATYIDGVLLITLPKREEAKVKPARAIEIA
ncbi:MAG: Hsp20/alpha crystallin family protein [Bacteroidota bacterium]